MVRSGEVRSCRPAEEDKRFECLQVSSNENTQICFLTRRFKKLLCCQVAVSCEVVFLYALIKFCFRGFSTHCLHCIFLTNCSTSYSSLCKGWRELWEILPSSTDTFPKNISPPWPLVSTMPKLQRHREGVRLLKISIFSVNCCPLEANSHRYNRMYHQSKIIVGLVLFFHFGQRSHTSYQIQGLLKTLTKSNSLKFKDPADVNQVYCCYNT